MRLRSATGTGATPLTDSFGRVHRDLRISVTDRCNYRCTYCMPAEGMEWLPRSELLTFEEIERVARVCVERYGIDSIRLTGGEPTVRSGLPDLVGRLAALGVDVALTTNGSRLRTLARPLADAGPAPHQHLLRLAARRSLRRADPARRPPLGPRRHRRGARGRARAR